MGTAHSATASDWSLVVRFAVSEAAEKSTHCNPCLSSVGVGVLTERLHHLQSLNPTKMPTCHYFHQPPWRAEQGKDDNSHTDCAQSE